jgi:hypothetical protein
VGDVKLGLKYKVLDDYGHDPVGLAVRGFAKLPTADEAKGLGTGGRPTGQTSSSPSRSRAKPTCTVASASRSTATPTRRSPWT